MPTPLPPPPRGGPRPFPLSKDYTTCHNPTTYRHTTETEQNYPCPGNPVPALI